MKKCLLGGAIMVKNEINIIEKTLKSCHENVDIIIVLDTGSTDGTQNFITQTCKKLKIKLKLYEEPFIDFSTSRNKLLQLSRPYAKYLLLLDSNDEIKNGHVLKPFLRKVVNSDVFTCKSLFENDVGIEGSKKIFYKYLIIKSSSTHMYYTESIHEYITSKKDYTYNEELSKTDFYLYQNRSLDKSSVPRLENDVELLLKQPDVNRNMFYLGITYYNLKNYPKSYEWSYRRVLVHKSGDKYDEYCFVSYQMLLYLSYHLNSSNFNKIYDDILIYCNNTRPEPYIIKASKLMNENKHDEAYPLLQLACQCPIPSDINAIYDLNLYENVRFKLLNICKYVVFPSLHIES